MATQEQIESNPELWGHKRCRRCSIVKPVGDFYFANGYPRSYCIPCSVKHTNNYIRERNKKKKANGEHFDVVFVIHQKLKLSQTHAGKRGGEPCCAKVSDLVAGYTQSCELCGKNVGTRIQLHHCHKTGKFLGWLCSLCNVGMGNFLDNPAAMRKAADWLEGRINGNP